MKYQKLGWSDMEVSRVCLGTMTFGVQNTEEEAHQQLDYAIKERGVNFLDTAELYPVPTSRETQGRTEKYIGTWLAKNQDLRDKVHVATKVMGYSKSSHIPSGRDPSAQYAAANSDKKHEARLDAANIEKAVDASLARLQTSYIDLYQLHWPDRYVPCFGSTVYNYSRHREKSVSFEETLKGLKKILDQGKIKHWGVSNESSFGVCQLCHWCDKLGVPYPVSIQNSFSLVHRQFETELAETCAPWNLNIGLLAWSPLAGGALSGKYMNGQKPPNSRFTIFEQYQERFCSSRCSGAIAKYYEVAKKEDTSLVKMSLSWIADRDYMQSGSTIIGSTTMKQLEECIDAFDVKLSKEAEEAIDQIHLDCRDPSQAI
ncbi:aldo/keto reductase [Chloropicon primus]|uniref:Aldo/keto reductase n=1 Tax=Chloropicon primus TaxID=1764295 RepID=A0A5B8MIC8_9CHLO|nr:aldo/keto reductase [Chloropicon primus]UPQ98350.1 aldo/keto reductase [Chloropicon primus]|mmetsp:Transcript_14338/g.40778  ORF Transcript_14338/g.40778 Transcript_14338/m.40778 type:complete len:372 (+) Transcript_14338:67-1182(+)|eukprot:QDZ19142.1 aldo/keto reductase [Chloropicon primus]